MSRYQRPWWLIVNRPAGLTTTIREESRPGERIFFVHGEPLVQGLAWLTWGPVAAVTTVLLLAGLALALDIRAQSNLVRGAFIIAFLALPALAWAITAIILNERAQKYVEAERQADSCECIIHLNLDSQELCFSGSAQPEEQKVAFKNIHQVKVIRPIGERHHQKVCLAVETERGSLTLLDEALGTHLQKVDLANELEKSLKAYNRKTPSV